MYSHVFVTRLTGTQKNNINKDIDQQNAPFDSRPVSLTLNFFLPVESTWSNLFFGQFTSTALACKMLLSVAILVQHLHWLVPAVIMFGSAPCFLMIWWPAKVCTAVLPKRFYRRADDFLFSTYLRMLLFFFENCTGIEVRRRSL